MTVTDQAFQGVMQFLDQPSVKRQLQQYWSHPLVQQTIQQFGPELAKLGAGHPEVTKSLFRLFTKPRNAVAVQEQRQNSQLNAGRQNKVNRPRNNSLRSPRIPVQLSANGPRNSSRVL